MQLAERGGISMSTGTDFKIDTGKMASVAQAISNQLSIIRNCFDSIRTEYSGLKGNFWEGASADAYDANMKKLCSETAHAGIVTTGFVIETLEDYVQNLNKAASDFNSTENRLESLQKSLPTDIFGI